MLESYLLSAACNSDETQIFSECLRRNILFHNEFLDKTKSILSPCIASFSHSRDQLSQWRGYSSRGGYSIGFHPHTLTKYAEKQFFKKVKVEYFDKDHYPKDFTDTCRKFCEKLKKLLIKELPGVKNFPVSSLIHIYTDESNVDIDTQLKKVFALLNIISLDYLHILIDLIPKYKHASFEEENEVRFVKINNEDLEFAVHHNCLKPYIPLHFELSDIQEIIIGPTNNSDLCELGLVMLKKKLNAEHIKISKSDIPYRSSL